MSYIYVRFSIPGEHYVHFNICIVHLLVAEITTKEELTVVQSL